LPIEELTGRTGTACRHNEPVPTRNGHGDARTDRAAAERTDARPDRTGDLDKRTGPRAYGCGQWRNGRGLERNGRGRDPTGRGLERSGRGHDGTNAAAGEQSELGRYESVGQSNRPAGFRTEASVGRTVRSWRVSAVLCMTGTRGRSDRGRRLRRLQEMNPGLRGVSRLKPRLGSVG